MCVGSAPKVEAPRAVPPAPAPPPAPDLSPVQPAVEDATPSTERKRKGRDALRIDRTSTAPSGSSGLNIPL